MSYYSKPFNGVGYGYPFNAPSFHYPPGPANPYAPVPGMTPQPMPSPPLPTQSSRPQPSPKTTESGERAAGPSKSHPLNPMDWNLSKLVPVLGVLGNLTWGLANITENQLHKNHLPKNPVFRKLAVNLPVVNVLYGLINMIGAFVQGYAIRTLAFGSFTAFSAALFPMMMRYNKGLEHHLTTGKPLAEAVAGLKKWTTLYNLVAPIGLLTGLFSITKVAQSTPNLTLEHPEGHTIRHLSSDAPPGKDLLSLVLRNGKTEWSSFKETLRNSGRHAISSLKNVGQAFRNLVAPPPELADESPMGRFTKPITDGFLVPLCYAHATVGRVAASAIAALMFVGGLSMTAPTKASSFLNRSLYRAMNIALLWGHVVGGTPASLFTKFNDWPIALSMGYRTSALAYSMSAVCAVMNMMGKKNVNVPILSTLYKDGKLFGLDEKIWTKVGAFIQGTSYFMNLLLKSRKADKNPAPPGADSHDKPHATGQLPQAAPHHRTLYHPWMHNPYAAGSSQWVGQSSP